MKTLFLTILIMSLAACTSTGTIQQSNSKTVVILDRAGNYGDQGAVVAAEHCAKYEKVAVFYSSTGPVLNRRSTYLCR